MATGRLLDLGNYRGTLPYSSELFGVYQPMIGWRSRKIILWLTAKTDRAPLVDRLVGCFDSAVKVSINQDCAIGAENLRPAGFVGPRLRSNRSLLLTELAAILEKQGYVEKVPDKDGWQELTGQVEKVLEISVLRAYNERSIAFCQNSEARRTFRQAGSDPERLYREQQLKNERALAYESEVAGVLVHLGKNERYDLLEEIFYTRPSVTGEAAFKSLLDLLGNSFGDPLESFDPKGNLRDVTISPIGVTHLYRQFFFELDTFLGPPVAHLYVPPGSTSEILEVSTRRTLVEKTVEQNLETSRKTESSSTQEEDISEAVKSDNKQDMKLGVSSTVEQSWVTGNISATASINMDRSQSESREITHKRMRQQSAKLSTEIRENYKTTFKTVTETTDTVSKRYVISNPGPDMVNYELRRKMRQVAVQVQDVGTYLCWDTYVDEPGVKLGLSQLVHMAKPADLIPRPRDLDLPTLPDVVVPFTANAAWTFDKRQFGLVPTGSTPVPPGPEGYEIARDPANPEPQFDLAQISGNGEDFHGAWRHVAILRADRIDLFVATREGHGLHWDERVDFVLQGGVRYVPSAAKRTEFENQRRARTAEQAAVDLENSKKEKQAFFDGVRERIEQARSITKRKYEDLREEERIIVYRQLIRSLMTEEKYERLEDKGVSSDRDRHVLSQLINTIFDVDKMLYFVAPEWWKARDQGSRFNFGPNELTFMTPDAMVNFDDGPPRRDNYPITNKSLPAPKGSSLGWILQLDGDDLRNAFLNAPWVKAVIPVRPGREQAAINWLKNVGVEGSDGLNAAYAAADPELDAIREKLGLADGHVVTLDDAIQFLCKTVSEKHAESNVPKTYPDSEINDDNKVLATPIDKVYEHGFYPLQGGFRIDPTGPGEDANNKDKNFQIFDQWVEILPTDQIVPVAVHYNPITGRQIPPEE